MTKLTNIQKMLLTKSLSFVIGYTNAMENKKQMKGCSDDYNEGFKAGAKANKRYATKMLIDFCKERFKEIGNDDNADNDEIFSPCDECVMPDSCTDFGCYNEIIDGKFGTGDADLFQAEQPMDYPETFHPGLDDIIN